MDWETTPAVAEKPGTDLHNNADMVKCGNSGHGILVSAQFATTRLNKSDLNMNLVSGSQGLRDALPDMSDASPDFSTEPESLQTVQVTGVESPRYGRPSPGLPCSLGILQHWTKFSEAAVDSSPSPGSSLVADPEHTQVCENLVLSAHAHDTRPGHQSEAPTLKHFETTGTVVAVNHLERSIVLRHGDKLIKVTNVACLDKNFNLAFISDIARNEPSTNKPTSQNANYSELSDHKGNMKSANSNNILKKSGVEVRHVTLPQGYSSTGQHTNNLFMNTNDEQQVLVLDVGQGFSFVSSDSPTDVSCASADSSSPRTAALQSNPTPSHPPARLLKLTDKASTGQNIVSTSTTVVSTSTTVVSTSTTVVSTSTTDSQAACVTMDTDIDNVNTAVSSNGVSSHSQKQVPDNSSTCSNCSNGGPDLINKPTSLSNSTTKAMSLPRSVDSDMYSILPTALITKTNRISNKSFNGSGAHGAVANTFLLTKPSLSMHGNSDKIGKAFSATNSHSSSDGYKIPTKGSSVSIKTNCTNQQTVTFCIPSSENVLEKSLLPPSKANTLKLTSLGRQRRVGPSVHNESPNPVLPPKNHTTHEFGAQSTRTHGALNILQSLGTSTASSSAGSNLKSGNTGHKRAPDLTTRINEDNCDQNFNTAVKTASSTSSSGVLMTLARKTEMSLNNFRKGQRPFSEEVGVCNTTAEVSALHSSTTASDGSTASRSLTLKNCPAVSPSFKAVNSAHPLTLPSRIHSNNSESTSMDICDAAMSPSSLDTSLVSSDTGISSSTSLSSLASKSSDGSSVAANQSPQPTCASFTSSSPTSSTETHTAGETGRRLRVRHQRRFLPEKPRHKRQTLQDMTRPLKQWLYKHRENPYPTKLEKMELVKHSHMTLTQVSNWFANARRRLKNTVQGDDLTWERRIKDYNHFAEGNAELFSLPSSEDDEQWHSNDEFTVNGDPSSCNHSAISGSTSPSPVPALTSSLSDPGLMSATTTQPFLASPSLGMRYSPNLEEQQGAYHKYKHSILQRYLHDASQKIPVPEDDVVTSRARHRNLSSSTGSHDFEYLSTSSVSSPSHEMPHDSFDEFSEEFETIAIRRKVPDNSTTQNTEDMYWKEIGAALALASLARAHVSK